ncbi:MAG: putative hydrolase of the HAD superfamily [Bacteroidetes bacterium]|nr:MAG: putative hydrolase of the HAD superfamily [Bacteroidota bacterium]
MKKDYKVIGFDADDTLWVNEPYFRDSENAFCSLLSIYMEPALVQRVLFRIEVKNMPLYGYGVKAFMLSMMEAALEVSRNQLTGDIMKQIIALGKEQLNKEVVLLEGVSEVLEKMKEKGQKVVVITKGDLLDQERKLAKSGLDSYFHHVEIMSEKHENDYAKLLEHLEVDAGDFLMIGNSIKSDILPVLNIGGYGIHIPFHETWEFEKIDLKVDHPHFMEINHVSELHQLLGL